MVFFVFNLLIYIEKIPHELPHKINVDIVNGGFWFYSFREKKGPQGAKLGVSMYVSVNNLLFICF